MKLTKKIVAVFLSALFVLTPLCSTITIAAPALAVSISVNIRDFDEIRPDTLVEVKFTANGLSDVTYDIRLEGETISTDSEFSFTPQSLGLKNASYTLVAEAKNSDGATAMKIISFFVRDKIDVDFYYAEDESIVPSVDGATASVYNVEALPFNVKYGTTSDGNVSLDDAKYVTDYEQYALKYWNESLETDSTSGVPYQIFDVDVSDKTEGTAAIRYSGSTYASERIAIRVFNPSTSAWDILGSFYGSGSASFDADIATYSDDGIIHVMATLDYVQNGSDSFIWSTDPQHYTKFADLNDYYYQIYRYAADEYIAGNIGYVLTTGDIVDDLPTTSAAIEQWKVADKAMSYLEDAGVPNGIVSGNHDVGTVNIPNYDNGNANVNYTKYLEYFNASRYNSEAWYGGSLNNNVSHYDLVTIGNVDFIFLFLGYGVEATDETIMWANNVLERYSHRVAVVATHQYLDANTADYAPKSRGELIFETIVDPNPNVKMVLCGHDDGSLCIERKASDGRTVYEILSDYQFVEAEDDSFYDNEHYIGSVPECCGDGYIRILTVDGNTLSSITYSPVTNRYNPYGDRENLSIDLGDYLPSRFISTASFSAYIVGEELEEDFPSGDSAIVITEADGDKTYHHVSYYNYPQIPEESYSIAVDYPALEALIEEADAIDTDAYTSDSVSALQAAIEAAREVDSFDKAGARIAYYDLCVAIGALKEIEEVIDATTLESIYKYDLTTSKWTTSDAEMTQLSPTGISIVRAESNTNGWASIRYTGGAYEIKPENGKIYMNLDIDAKSAWSIYVVASQANLSTSLRMNFAIDNAFNRTDADSYNGVYNGVYEVTEAFVAAGFDPSATINIEGAYLFIVPGEVSYYCVEYLTDKKTASVDTSRIDKAISEAEVLDSSLYTAGSYAAVASALEAAKTAKNQTVQADVNLASLKLEQAIASLKLLSDIVPEPEGSLIPADEGLWSQNVAGTMKIFRDESNFTVLQNTNGEWPSADHNINHAYTTTTADKMLLVDVSIAGQSSFILSIDGEWVYINEFITANRDSSSGDIKAGSYTAEIPLSKLSDKENISISKLRVFAVGGAGDASSVTIRKMQIVDYVAPPKVEDQLAGIMPDEKDLTIVSGDGSASIVDGVLTVVNNGDGDLRVSFSSDTLFNLEILNALHLDFESTAPFKMAFHVMGSDGTSAWPNTSSDAYSDIFEISDDRAAAGDYDAYLEIRDNSASLADKSSAYFNQFIILVTGKGELKISVAEMVALDTFDWPEAEYGVPATPENLVYDHASKVAPIVTEKVDLLPYFNAGAHPIVSSTLQTENGMGLEIDLTKTPYLYYSFIVPDGGDFTFSIYSNSNYSPWLSYLDAQLSTEKPTLNYGAANWDANTSRQQYTKTSQTGVIDMREYLVNPEVQKWVVNQLKLYKSKNGSATVSYLFFGSADAVVPEVDPDPNPDPNPDPDTEYTLGDVNNDGAINQYDYILVKRHYFGTRILTDAEMKPADVNTDNKVDQYDYILICRHYFGTYVIKND